MTEKDKDRWIPSLKAKITNFIRMNSWEYVKIMNPNKLGRKLLPCKWVFKLKSESKRQKSRLCVKGFHQIPEVDYTESFPQ